MLQWLEPRRLPLAAPAGLPATGAARAGAGQGMRMSGSRDRCSKRNRDCWQRLGRHRRLRSSQIQAIRCCGCNHSGAGLCPCRAQHLQQCGEPAPQQQLPFRWRADSCTANCLAGQARYCGCCSQIACCCRRLLLDTALQQPYKLPCCRSAYDNLDCLGNTDHSFKSCSFHRCCRLALP